MLKVTSKISIPIARFEFSFSRSSGPGGQNVNKLNTKVTLRWNVTDDQDLPRAVHKRFVEKYSRRISNSGDLVMTSERFRNQGRNVADVLEKLKAMIEAVVSAPKKRVPTKPTKGSVKRRLQSKKIHSDKKKSRQKSGQESDH